MKFALALTALVLSTSAFAAQSPGNDDPRSIEISKHALACARQYNHIEPRESDDCFAVSIGGDNPNDVLVMEIHNAKCGGDPAVMPNRSILNMQDDGLYLYDPVTDLYHKCN